MKLCSCGRKLMLAARPDINGDVRMICEWCWSLPQDCICSLTLEQTKEEPLGFA